MLAHITLTSFRDFKQSNITVTAYNIRVMREKYEKCIVQMCNNNNGYHVLSLAKYFSVHLLNDILYYIFLYNIQTMVHSKYLVKVLSFGYKMRIYSSPDSDR